MGCNTEEPQRRGWEGERGEESGEREHEVEEVLQVLESSRRRSSQVGERKARGLFLSLSFRLLVYSEEISHR